jgi:site-specific DNA-cytosine methylase
MLTPQISSISVAEPLTHADFFAGLGVFSLAARELLISTQLLCEWNEFCQTTLQKNFPGVPIHDDIANLASPCQNGEIVR